MTGPLCLKDLNPQQYTAVTHPPGEPLLVLAGAGSGKTGVLVRRIAWLITQGTSPAHITAVTFTNKAAQEMRARLVGLVGEGPADQVQMGTFHSICARILRAHPHGSGRTTEFTIWDKEDQTRAITRIKTTIEGAEGVPDIKDRISRAKNHLVCPDEMRAWATTPHEQTTARVWAAYEQALADSDALDFDDLLVRVIDMLDTDRDLRARIHSGIHHLLVDEFQDTNPAQLRLLGHLTTGGGITVVGDDDQSIYGFRGADPECVTAFTRMYPGARLVALTRNYRCSPQIIRAANRILDGIPRAFPKHLQATLPDGPPVGCWWFGDPQAEADWIAGQITRALKAGTDPGDIAVLTRSRWLRHPIEQALITRGVPTRVLDGNGLLDSAPAKDAASYLRLVVNHRDQQALIRVAQIRKGLGAVSIDTLLGNGPDVMASITSPPAGLRPQARTALALLAEDLQALARCESAVIALERLGVIIATGHQQGHVALRDETDGRDLDVISDLAGSLAPSMGVKEWVTQVSLHHQQDPATQGVVLSTIHAAKGLEWPVVFVPGMEAGAFPSARSTTPPEQAEEARLAYVALTRAKRHLHLSGAATRNHKRRTPSPFWGAVNTIKEDEHGHELPHQHHQRHHADGGLRRAA